MGPTPFFERPENGLPPLIFYPQDAFSPPRCATDVYSLDRALDDLVPLRLHGVHFLSELPPRRPAGPPLGLFLSPGPGALEFPSFSPLLRPGHALEARP